MGISGQARMRNMTIMGTVTNLLELLNGTLVDTTALVDQVAGLETLSACHDMQQRRWE